MADEKIIFSMVGVSKTFTNQKKVLNNIYLSFFYGAKIGIIGLNGSGKSTLMKIIAGIDKNFQGEVVFSPGYSVGYLEQEPKLDDTKTVREVVEEGCAATVALMKEYEEINMKLCEPMSDDEMARLIERQGELYEQIDHVNGWELDSVLERAMDALRCPDPDQSVKVLSGGERRRVALCRLLLQQPDVLLLDEPRRTTAISSTTWRAGFSSSTAARASPGRATIRDGSSRRPSAWRWRRNRSRSAARPSNASWSGCACPPRAAMPSRKPVCRPTTR